MKKDNFDGFLFSCDDRLGGGGLLDRADVRTCWSDWLMWAEQVRVAFRLRMQQSEMLMERRALYRSFI